MRDESCDYTLYHSVRTDTGVFGDDEDGIYHNNIENKGKNSSVAFN